MSTNAHSLTSDFKQLLAEGHLAHGYLLFGESLGTLRAAGEALLRAVDGPPAGGSGPLLDSRIIIPDADGTISIDAVRDGAAFLWQKPVRAARKTLFIHDAGAMTAQAQNALLKIAEEPPAHGLLLLSVRNPQALLPTLASRFQHIAVRPEKSEAHDDPLEAHAAKLAKQFISGDARTRKAIIAEVFAEDDEGRAAPQLPHFVEHLMAECRKDPVKNFELMKRLTDRWAKMEQFNTNKKLQLESLI